MDLIGKVVDYLDPPQQSITEVNTMFPSRVEPGGAMKGGLILLKLNGLGNTQSAPFELSVEYTDAATGEYHCHANSGMLRFSAGITVPDDPSCEAALRKGLLLQRYAEVCREQMDGQSPKAEALPGLQQELEGFKRNIDEHFSKDEKMLRVLSDFEAFVKLFNTNLETEAANAKLYAVRDHIRATGQDGIEFLSCTKRGKFHPGTVPDGAKHWVCCQKGKFESIGGVSGMLGMQQPVEQRDVLGCCSQEDGMPAEYAAASAAATQMVGVGAY